MLLEEGAEHHNTSFHAQHTHMKLLPEQNLKSLRRKRVASPLSHFLNLLCDCGDLGPRLRRLTYPPRPMQGLPAWSEIE